jgi:hypothetical protein
MGQNQPVSVLVTNELKSARFVHRTLVVACVFLMAFALESTVEQHDKSALRLLRELSSIDLDKWTKRVENRQSVSLAFLVESVLEREAERAGMPIKRGLIVSERVALQVHPLASEVHGATVETLLMRVFRDVKTPELFYPDGESLRRRLRALFSGELVDGVEAYRLGSQFMLSKAELTLDTTRGAPNQAFLRLEWYGQDTNTSGVTGAAATRDIPLDGTLKHETYDFEHFVRDMNPELVELSRTNNIAGMTQPWSMSVRERLAPEWDEIKDRTLDAAYTHLQARLSETKGTVTLLGLTMHRQVNLFLASIILLVAQGALLLRVNFAKDMLRNDAGPMPDFPWFPLFSGWLARVLTFLSFSALPVMTFGFLLVRFGKPDFSARTIAAVLAAGVGGILAVQAYRSALELQRITAIGRGRVDERRVKSVKARMAPRARTGSRRSRVFGRVLLVTGFVAGPAGAVAFSVYLLGVGIGSRASGSLPLLAMLASLVCVPTGWVLASGRKELVLFLRRFGNEALNDSVRDLVQTSLRKRARLVTLDDSAFIPLGPRWLGLASSLAPSGVVLGAIAVGYAGFAKVARSELIDETPFGEALVFIQIGIVLIGMLAGLTAVILFVAALRAHFTGRRVVRDDHSRAQVVRRLRKLRSFAKAPVIAAPMATVVTVRDSEWQTTVVALARMCDVTLIDISQPRENIRWELATLREAGVRIVLLAHREALVRWWDVKVDDAHLAAQLRCLATGLPLVTYDAPDRLTETELLDLM